jgi:hypothetical protein
MTNELTASQERELKKGINERLNLLRKRGSNRRLDHLADAENPNRQIRKTDCEKAISKLHTSRDSGRAITKAAAPATTNAGAAIAALHSDRSLAGRTITGNGNLVAKLASAIGQVVLKDYGSAREAKREIRKLLATDVPARPRNHQILKRAKAKSGEAVLTLRKGNDYPYEITVDGYHHSEHFDIDGAERAFVILCAGVN